MEPNLPVIDVSGLFSTSPEARRSVAAELGAACRGIGFFYLTGHGVPADLLALVFAEADRFFGQPDAGIARLRIRPRPPGDAAEALPQASRLERGDQLLDLAR